MIRCMIVDDEPLAQDILKEHIRRSGKLDLVAACANAPEAFGLLHQYPVDLLFLDIQLPSVTGIDFLRSLKDPPRVIFTTAYSEYAHTGFELDAVDYLLKPVSYERFEKAIRKFLREKPEENSVEKTYSFFKVSGKLIKLEHEDLLYAQSVKDYLQLHTRQGNFLTHMTMKHLTELLPARVFARVHRSYLVNLGYIEKMGRHTLILKGVEIPVGENFRAGLGAFWK